MTPPPTVAELRERARAKLTAGELRALRVELRAEVRAELAAVERPAKSPRVRETPEVVAAARRMIAAVGERAASDVDALPLLAGLAGVVDAELRRAVDGLRDPARNAVPYSMADVARALGITRQAAGQRFGRRDVTGDDAV